MLSGRARLSARPLRARTIAVIAAVALFTGLACIPTAARPSLKASPAAVPPFPDPGAATATPVDTLEYDLGDAAFSYPGFPAAMEVRGRVYTPATLTGPAPLVLVMHGRHLFCAISDDEFVFEYPCPPGSTEIPSYHGYDQLGRTLASHGYVVASVSANSINANDSFVADGGADARSRLLFRHLELWDEWNTSATGPFGSRFVGRIDLTRVGLMGHSRGGEGVMEAAIRNQLLNNPYGIKAVVPLAPVDFGRRLLSSVPFGVILPYCDGDVFDLQGAAFYDDARYRLDGDRAPKQTALLYGANHNFFNTVWTSGFPGAFDDWGSGSGDSHCEPGAPGRLTAAQQRSAGTALIAGFIRRHVGGETDLQAFVTGVAPNPASFGPARVSIAHHDPNRLDLNRFNDASTARTNNLGTPHLTDRSAPSLFCSSEEFASCVEESSFVVNRTTRAEVGWVQPTATITEVVPESAANVSGYDGLRFRVAIPGDARNRTLVAQNFTVTLTDRAGASASVAARPYGNALVRPPGLNSVKSVLNGVRIPLVAFTGINLSRIRSVVLRFDRTAAGRLAVSDLAFTDEGTGALVAPSSGPASTLAGLIRGSCDKAQWANSKYVCAIFRALLGRDAFDEEVAARNRFAGTEAGRRRMVDAIVAGPNYRDLRFRALDQTVAEHSNAFFAGDATADPLPGTPEGRIVSLIADGILEFSAEVGGDLGRFVDAAYLGVIGRGPTPATRALWVQRITNDFEARRDLALYLVASTDYARRVTDRLYRQYLGRPATAAAMNDWIDRIRSGQDGENDVVRHLVGSTEFFNAQTG